MQLLPKKLLTVTTEAVLESEIVDILGEMKISGYTIDDVRGRGQRGIRRAEWEQSRTIRVQIADDWERLQPLMSRLHSEFEEQYALFMFVTDVQVL